MTDTRGRINMVSLEWMIKNGYLNKEKEIIVKPSKEQSDRIKLGEKVVVEQHGRCFVVYIKNEDLIGKEIYLG